MPRGIRGILLIGVLILLVVVIQPRLGAQTIPSPPPDTSPANPADVMPPFAEHLERSFWLADHLDLQAALIENQVTVADWLQQINQSNIQFLCLGETHNESFRQFLAQTIFPQLDVNQLLLEADADQANELLANASSGTNPIRLLGADIGLVIRAAKTRNPNVQIVGIDETDQQTAWRNQEQANSDRRRLSRDGFIAQNIQEGWRSDQRHVALYGANHCAAHDLGLGNARPFFRQVAGVVVPREQSKSVLVVSSAQSNPLTIAIQRATLNNQAFVIPNTQAIAPALYNYRWDLKSFFDNYDAIVYFPLP
ncbi:hypothetical protein IQ268_21860 [Oculatella sp. LEGE 06141]|uniref:hypothetical protein n=1 Tax=Oculatella sp. LEGE 06141 TaxID=1828648 RepID=UPI00187DF51C|nr:hypothetical protein [Oculatella sp. LEGE 06141]MBE9181211.1 hypothetical protein [Oculatella sp. LEGE 06141]